MIVLCALVLHSGHFALIFPLLSLRRKAARLKQTAWSRPTIREVVHNGVEYPCSMGVVVLKRNFEHPVFHGALVFTN